MITFLMHYKKIYHKKTDPLEPVCKKTVYYSLEEAQEMIRYISETRITKGIRAYKCDLCGFWHLTSKID